MKVNSERLIKAGAAVYVLWGVLHVWVGLDSLNRLWTGGSRKMLERYGSGLEAGVITDPGNFVSNIVAQHSANLVLLGLLSIIVAATLIWRQEKMGFWLNLVILGIADAAFVFALLLPGYILVKDGLPGPILFVVAATLTGLGFFAPKPAVQRQHEPGPAVSIITRPT